MLATVTRKEAYAALRVRMDSTLTAYNTDNSASIQCFYDNVVRKRPSDLGTYLTFNITSSGTSDLISPTVFRQVGKAVVKIYIPIGEGTNESLDISDYLESSDGFLLQKWPDNVMEITNIASRDIGPDGSNFVTNVNITFQYNKGTRTHGTE
jgi:hypothetical protein